MKLFLEKKLKVKRNKHPAKLAVLCTAETKSTAFWGARSKITDVSITENVKPVLHC